MDQKPTPMTTSVEQHNKPRRKKWLWIVALTILLVGAAAATIAYFALNTINTKLTDQQIIEKAQSTTGLITSYDASIDLELNYADKTQANRAVVTRKENKKTDLTTYWRNSEYKLKATEDFVVDGKQQVVDWWVDIYNKDNENYISRSFDPKQDRQADSAVDIYTEHKEVNTLLTGVLLLEQYGDKVQSIDRTDSEYVLNFALDQDTFKQVAGMVWRTAGGHIISSKDRPDAYDKAAIALSADSNVTIRRSTVKMAIDKETFALKSVVFDLGFTSELQTAGGVYDIKRTIKYNSLNQPVNVEVPSELLALPAPAR